MASALRRQTIAWTVGNNVTGQDNKNKSPKGEILANLLWTAFGIIGAITYYPKGEYLIGGIMSLFGVFYAYRLIKSMM